MAEDLVKAAEKLIKIIDEDSEQDELLNDFDEMDNRIGICEEAIEKQKCQMKEILNLLISLKQQSTDSCQHKNKKKKANSNN